MAFIPSVHLKNLAGKPEPVVVMVGDSIGRPAPGLTFDPSQSLWGILKAELRAQNPGRKFRFFNRALGGKRIDHLATSKFATLDALAENAPLQDWPDMPRLDTATQSWMDTIVDLNPDAVFLNFGMNCNVLLSESHLQHVLDEFRTRLPHTDLVFFTNIVPNFHSANPNLGGLHPQNGRLFSAHRYRTLALYHGYGVIDVGQFMCKHVAGFDPLHAAYVLDQNRVNTTLPITLPQTDQNYLATLTLKAAPRVWRTRLRFDLSDRDVRGCAAFFELYDNNGQIAVEFGTLNGAAFRYLDHTSDVATPLSVPMTINVAVGTKSVGIHVNDDCVFEGLVQRPGGRFAPQISFANNKSEPVRLTSYTARFLKTEPKLDFAGMFGQEGVPGHVGGGNTLNHPSARGWVEVFEQVLASTNLTLPA